jgi:hypothetical protein
MIPLGLPLESFDSLNHQLNSVPDGFRQKGTVPIRLDWTPLKVGDLVTPDMVVGHWIWQVGRTEIIAPQECRGTVLDLRDPDCDILDEAPSQPLMLLTP